VATVTFLVHPERPDALTLATDTAGWLTDHGHRARILSFSAPDTVAEAGVEKDLTSVDLSGSTVAVSMGGDGTFLRVVRLAAEVDVPVLGVNFGRLGDLSPGDAPCVLLALNEVVIEKIDFGHTVRLTTCVDGEEALTYSADGLIMATPTGSTAYNLSAGGPILAPTLRAMVVTPVAPHFSLDRSLVLTEEQEVCVKVAPDRAGALVIDGLDVGRLQPGATVTCAVAERAVRVVRNEPQTFGNILRFRLLADRGR